MYSLSSSRQQSSESRTPVEQFAATAEEEALYFQSRSSFPNKEPAAGKRPATQAIATGPTIQSSNGLAKPPKIHPSAVVITLMDVTIDANLRSWRIGFAVVSALFDLRAM